MNIRLLLPVSLILAVLAWTVLSWPLPLHLTSVVTVSSHGGDGGEVRAMMPSDALQLLYYYQLVKEWVTGITPIFYNLYEFNIGNDAERYFPGGYYLPFSLIYALGASLLGQAFGMNLTVVVSLWFTVLATWLLIRRYVEDEWVAALFGVFAIVFPYRWITLFDASPTGFTMMWVPFIFLGLDMAMRDGKIRGGLLSAAALLSAYVGDVHVFFFSVLATPAWCLLALTMKPSIPGGWIKRFIAQFKALLPVAVGAVLIVFLVRFQSAQLEDSHMAGGRSLGEVALFSPTKHGFFNWNPGSVAGQVYLGWPVVVLLAAGGLAILSNAARRPRQELRRLLFWSLLLGGAFVASILALGPHGLRHGGLFGLIRELIPPYAMIRQAGKIFCLMPTIMAVAGAVSLNALIRVAPLGSRWRTLCLVVFGAVLIVGYAHLSAPTLSRLEQTQGAYKAVAEDAQSRGTIPRALVITLWPGDSHFASVYQHFALAHHVRIVNGYSPAFAKAYFEEVFLPLYNINQGYLGGDQVDTLLSWGVDHLILHEDMYPEKVAPFPVTFAIKRFLEHPRLEFLAQDGSVWAFRILEKPKPDDPAPGVRFSALKTWETFFPARHWEMERSLFKNADQCEDQSVSNHAYLELTRQGASVSLSPVGAPPAQKLRWLIRARGEGELQAHVQENGEDVFVQTFPVHSADWKWFPVYAPIVSHAEVGLRLEHGAGAVDLDSALLTAGTWPFLEPGESLTIPAPSFFHAGYTDLNTGKLVFRRGLEPRIFFYGPKMPFAPGTYDITFSFDSLANAGIELGMLYVETDWNLKQGPGYLVVAGQPPQIQMEVTENLPVNLIFAYFGYADMTVDHVAITRIR